MALSAISTPGDNILLPDPGFPLYSTLCCRNRVESRFYPIDLENDGLIDLMQLEAKIDKKTKAILINNPSNPTGIVFPKWHLEAILRIAYKYKVSVVI
jgi:tyrosine aminotransferase